MNIRLGTKGKRPLRSLTPCDKIHAIQRIHDGESKASVARDIGVPESTLRGWCKNEDKLRFMSRQSAAEKMCADVLADKLDTTGSILGPPEKRQRLDMSLPMNFSSKLKFDELGFKRSPLNGLDYTTNKGLLQRADYNADYATFNGVETIKNKVFGADINRPVDPSLAAISPLSSLTHLTGISQSPLAISFNELATNLNLLAHLNPNLAAISGINNFTTNTNALRNIKTKAQSQMQSPSSETGDRSQPLSVKDWAKQKPSAIALSDSKCGPNLIGQNDANGVNIKGQSPSLPSLIGNLQSLSGLSDDPLLYWLKSQQAMLEMNSLYPPTVGLEVGSPPIRSSTPQQSSHPATSPPILSASLTPSSTPSGSLDDKNTAWYNWCKAFGASLHSLNPNAPTFASLQMNSLNQQTGTEATGPSNDKVRFENILYSHLTKETENPSEERMNFNDRNSIAQNDVAQEAEVDTESPKDLSGKSIKVLNFAATSIPLLDNAAENNTILGSEITFSNSKENINEENKNVLSNIAYKISDSDTTRRTSTTPLTIEMGCESDTSFTCEVHQHNNNDDDASNNNNNSNKTDEEEKIKYIEYSTETDSDDSVAIRHGEKFLQWLENCSNPRVTAVQLTQLRFLIDAIKSSTKIQAGEKIFHPKSGGPKTTCGEIEDNIQEDTNKNKIRRRK